MKEYSTPTMPTKYTRNNMEGHFKHYQEACIERNEYKAESDKLTHINYISEEDPFNHVKDTIVVWLADMAKAGLVDKNDSASVDKLLTSAYEKLNSSAINEKLESLNHGINIKYNGMLRAFDEVQDNTGYLTKVLNVVILGLKIDKVEIVNKILEKEGVHVIKNYFDNGSKERGNFDIKIYADNKEILSDIQDEISMASLKNNFKGNVKESRILHSEEVFRLLTDLRNEVMIGSHINKIMRPDEMVYRKPKNNGKPKF